MHFQVTGDTESVVFLTGEADEGFSVQQLTVLNNAGEEILLVPKDIETAKVYGPSPIRYTLSPNGKYLGIEFSLNRTGFYDLENGTSWELLEDWAIDFISNDGQAKLSFQSKRKEVDLKKYLEAK